MVCVFPFSKYIFNFLAMPITELLSTQSGSSDLIFTGLQQGFMVNVKISFFGGFIVSFPFIGFQIWRFIAPGLYKRKTSFFAFFDCVSSSIYHWRSLCLFHCTSTSVQLFSKFSEYIRFK